jgi:hypothetical protein
MIDNFFKIPQRLSQGQRQWQTLRLWNLNELASLARKENQTVPQFLESIVEYIEEMEKEIKALKDEVKSLESALNRCEQANYK